MGHEVVPADLPCRSCLPPPATATHTPHLDCPAADGYVVCYALGRKAFNELLGPIEDVWRYEALRKVQGQGYVGCGWLAV